MRNALLPSQLWYRRSSTVLTVALLVAFTLQGCDGEEEKEDGDNGGGDIIYSGDGGNSTATEAEACRETGGSCAWMACDTSRNAVCERSMCVCPVGVCAVNGACPEEPPTSTPTPTLEQNNEEKQPPSTPVPPIPTPPPSMDEMEALRSQLALANSRIASLEAMVQSSSSSSGMCRNVTCTEECASLSKTGRWRFGQYGHECADPFTGKSYCYCSKQADPVVACAEVLSTDSRRLRAQNGNGRAQMPLPQSPAQLAKGKTDISKSMVHEEIELHAPTLSSEQERLLGSPRETIEDFCDEAGLLRMQGRHYHDLEEGNTFSDLKKLESSVLSDIADEMEDNNVDKVARDIFTFYVCVRWVPDDLFWRMARQELAANLIESVVDHTESLDQAISELYQNYKYVPMLCTRNFNVFDETDDFDHTYFRHFKKDVQSLIGWLSDHHEDEVSQRLKQVDEVFCGNTNMNDPGCSANMKFDEFMNQITGFMGDWGWNRETIQDKWAAMRELFKTLDHAEGQSGSFQAALRQWKSMFSFHSFVQKPGGMPHQQSPLSTQRFLVCFGKRVASELHRRPAGRYIMTDQNNIGCHGFWENTEVKNMLNHMLELWKPPTCQIATMTYTMKRQILKMYSDMNERLFDALPTLLMDEQLEADGLLEAHMQGPKPYDPQVKIFQGLDYIDGMRVRALVQLKEPEGCSDSDGWFSGWDGKDDCRHIAEVGDYGNVVIKDDDLYIVWDKDSAAQAMHVVHSDVEVVPRDWKASTTFGSLASNFVAGISTVTDAIQRLWDNMFRTRYTNLANLMSGSTSKWVVCPVANDTNFTLLDSQLGVEDAAFRDHQKEAYSKWTGYVSNLPGEVCVDPEFFSLTEFPGSKMCEISELHADHLEKYTLDDNSSEQFLCPLKTSFPAPEQLTVLKDKGECLLHMTPEQQRHYQWPYNGAHPNRRQYDRKANRPNTEYELIQLVHVPETGKVSYARACSVEELVQSPRFCPPMKFHSRWPSLEEMAKALGEAALGSLGMGASAITAAIASYGDIFGTDQNASQTIRQLGQAIGEDLWDYLTGAGRLLESAVDHVSKSVSYGLPGADQRDIRIESAIFQESNAGELLHQLSFQRSIGANNRTSNAKERYQRVVVTMPCEGFNPALEFATKKHWTANVLRMIQSAVNSGLKTLLDAPFIQMAVRGEGRLFSRTLTDGDESSWFRFGASMSLVQEPNGEAVVPPNCAWSDGWNSQCGPAEVCEVGPGMIGFRECLPKVRVSTSGWWSVLDPKLVSVVAPSVSQGYHSVKDLKAYTATLYCGQKRLFNETNNPVNSESLLTCMHDGVQSNARLRAAAPWKLYFPDEVIVVAVLNVIKERQCSKASSYSLPSDDATLCDEYAVHTEGIDEHLTDEAKSDGNGVYQGLHTGADFPEGTPVELVLRPEDILEAAGVISRS